MRESGKKTVTNSVVIQIKAVSQKSSLIGYIVSKKVCQNQVERNRIKRRLRAAIRSIEQKQNTFNAVLIARPKALTLNFNNLCQDIERGINKCL